MGGHSYNDLATIWPELVGMLVAVLVDGGLLLLGLHLRGKPKYAVIGQILIVVGVLALLGGLHVAIGVRFGALWGLLGDGIFLLLGLHFLRKPRYKTLGIVLMAVGIVGFLSALGSMTTQ